MTPTIPTDKLAAIAQHGQEAISAAVETWTQTAQNYAPSFSPEAPLPTAADAHRVVKASFDLAEQLLADQRDLTVVLVDAGTQAADSIGHQFRTLTNSLGARIPSAA